MEFIGPGVGQLLLNQLAQAVSIDIAVAFFNPRRDVEKVLGSLPELHIVVSEEYTITNPESLERLKNATIKTVPTDHDKGKLHAKVVIAKRADGTKWALIGSANITSSGLFGNQEACIHLTSAIPDDASTIADVERWFEKLFSIGRDLDLEEAKRIRTAQSTYRLVRRPRTITSASEYWAIKTTVGSSGVNHWRHFLSESVVAIGWEKLGVDPSRLDDKELFAIIEKTYPTLNPHHALKTIRNFINMADEAILLICKGFVANQKKSVDIHGFARITGGFTFDPNSTWWKYKREVVIQEVKSSIARDSIARALGKGTSMHTLECIKRDGFEAVAKELGVVIAV